MKCLKTIQMFTIVRNTKLVLFSLFVLFSVACKKKEVNADASIETQNDIIQLLNSKDSQSALVAIDEALIDNPDNSDLLFYKASALAMESGIDLLALYPVLQIKFFHESVYNWDNLKKYENPYKKFFNIGQVNVQIDINEKLKKKINESLAELKEDFQSFDYENVENYFLLFEVLNSRILDNKFDIDPASKELILQYIENFDKYRELYAQIEKRLRTKLALAKEEFKDYEEEYRRKISDEFNSSLMQASEISNNSYDYDHYDNDIDYISATNDDTEQSNQSDSVENVEQSAKSEVSSSLDENSIDSLLDEMIYLQGKAYQSSHAINTALSQSTGESLEGTSVINDEESTQVNISLDVIKKNAMKFIWGVYIGLPLMTSLPVVEDDSFDNLDEALSILNNIRSKKDHLYKKSSSYMSFLSAISFLSIVKKSLLVEQVIDPLSFICNFNQEHIFNSYHRIHSYINYFMMSSTNYKFSNKYFSEFSKFSKSIEDGQGNLSLDAVNVIDESVNRAKSNVCDVY